MAVGVAAGEVQRIVCEGMVVVRYKTWISSLGENDYRVPSQVEPEQDSSLDIICGGE